LTGVDPVIVVGMNGRDETDRIAVSARAAHPALLAEPCRQRVAHSSIGRGLSETTSHIGIRPEGSRASAETPGKVSVKSAWFLAIASSRPGGQRRDRRVVRVETKPKLARSPAWPFCIWWGSFFFVGFFFYDRVVELFRRKVDRSASCPFYSPCLIVGEAAGQQHGRSRASDSTGGRSAAIWHRP